MADVFKRTMHMSDPQIIESSLCSEGPLDGHIRNQ